MKTLSCIKCKRNYKVLTTEYLCYSCHVEKYKTSPTKGLYYRDKSEGSMDLKKKDKTKKKKQKGMKFKGKR